MNLDRDFLKGFLEKNTLTFEEKERLLDYLESDSIADLESVAEEEFYKEINDAEEITKDLSSEDVLRKIHKSIVVPKPSFFQVVMAHRVKLAVAASVLLMAMLFSIFKMFSNENSSNTKMEVAQTGKDERKLVKLSDGSLVSLEPGSSLEYAEIFNGKTREVHLKGEAFFVIAKDATHPFIVHTPHINTTVLGTSFNVKAYAFVDSKVEVVTGKVKVQLNNDTRQLLVLSPSQSAVFSSGTGKLQPGKAPRDALFYKQRREGMFKYRGVALREVVEDLQYHYNETITIKGAANNYIFYGDFHVNEKLEKVLNLIAISINTTIKKDRNGYLIVGRS